MVARAQLYPSEEDLFDLRVYGGKYFPSVIVMLST